MLNSSIPDASFNRGDSDAGIVRLTWRPVVCGSRASNLQPQASSAVRAGLAHPEQGQWALPGWPAGRLVTTSTSADDTLKSCQLAPKLDFPLTLSKQITCDFLIDNFCSDLAGPSLATRLPAEALPKEGHSPVSPQLAAAGGGGPLHSNRPSPRLEILVSHRKQTVGPISNRPKFALCNFRCLSFSASVPPCHFASSPLLIANDMHSRKLSNPCKQSTYQILIANEFHYLRSTNNIGRGFFAASSPGLGIQAPLAQQTGLRPPAIRYNEKQATGEPIASPGRTHGISYRAAA